MRSTRFIFIPGLILVITLTTSSMNDDFLPAQLGSWSLSSDTLYTPGNLYEYINGGAELYLSYGFQKVQSLRYTAENQPDIILDVFDMNSPEDAYGVFMYSAEDISELVGQGTQYNEGFMLFWMDHYFISILAYPETPESKAAIMEIARTLEKKIGRQGELPVILKYLPAGGLDTESIRYFHHYAWLNSHYYIATENILLIADDTRAVMARYGGTGDKHILLLVEYPSGERAGEAYDSFTENYLPELQGNRSLQLEDGKYTGIERKENVLIIVFNAGSAEIIDGMIEQVEKNINANQS